MLLSSPLASGSTRTSVVERCQRDGWPESVERCLSDARDEASLDGCLSKLSPEHAKQLKVAVEPLRKQHDERERTEALETFRVNLAKLELERATAAAPDCASYRTAIDEQALEIQSLHR